ncbi:hypothetical protein GGI12_002648 [Dipsacomyces acuminosporus]|nr:hypothetical protein GGI12_002648 [Dipsacomyces acuminosporus]
MCRLVLALLSVAVVFSNPVSCQYNEDFNNNPNAFNGQMDPYGMYSMPTNTNNMPMSTMYDNYSPSTLMGDMSMAPQQQDNRMRYMNDDSMGGESMVVAETGNSDNFNRDGDCRDSYFTTGPQEHRRIYDNDFYSKHRDEIDRGDIGQKKETFIHHGPSIATIVSYNSNNRKKKKNSRNAHIRSERARDDSIMNDMDLVSLRESVFSQVHNELGDLFGLNDSRKKKQQEHTLDDIYKLAGSTDEKKVPKFIMGTKTAGASQQPSLEPYLLTASKAKSDPKSKSQQPALTEQQRLEQVRKQLQDAKIIPDVLSDSFKPEFPLAIKFQPEQNVTMGQLLSINDTRVEPVIEFDAPPGQIFTVGIVDPDSPSAGRHGYRSFRHFLMSNLDAAELSEMNVLTGYQSPDPGMGSGLHRYVVVVMRQQQGKMNILDGDVPQTRVRFDIEKWGSDRNMKPVAATYFIVKRNNPSE